MKSFARAALGLLALAVASCASISGGRLPPPTENPVILVSIDGFRPDYLERGLTPTLSAFAERGVRAQALTPSFPSMTFPNHYTLVTGLRPDRHGIVNNTIRDPAIPGVTFSLSNKEAVVDRRWWDQATPLWVTVERAGLDSATMFWPGSEAAIQGVRPDQWKPYEYGLDNKVRVDTVLGWLDQPQPQRPEFVTLYFENVDSVAHREGPDAEATNQAIRDVDAAMARLLEGLRARGLQDRANIVVVSDHGMAAVSPERTVYLDDVVPADRFRVAWSGPFAALEPTAAWDASAEAALLREHPRMQCWRKEKLPARFQYGRNPRVPSIVCVAEAGWQIATREDAARRPPRGGGNHGFDPAHPTMAGLFLADGPAFRDGARLPRIDNVDVYPLLARLLGVRPEPHQGDAAATARALR